MRAKSLKQRCASYDSSCFVASGLVVDQAHELPVEVVMISQESTTKDVKLVGCSKNSVVLQLRTGQFSRT